MADPVLNRSTQVQYFRRKPPCQLRRDQERSRQWKDKHTRSESGATCVAAISRPSADFSTECSTSRGVQHSTAQNTEEEEEGSKVTQECTKNMDIPLPTDSNSVSLQEPDVDNEQTIDNTIAGFDTGTVKTYVASLTDRSTQKQLRDQTRNKTFRKVTIHQSDDNKDILLCESDDIVLEYTCDRNSDDSFCSYWFIKQKLKSLMPREERVKISSLQNGKRLPTTLHRETLTRAERELQALRGLISFYLG